MPIDLTPIPNSPTGVYTSIDLVRLEMGEFNETVAADADNQGDVNEIAAREQYALDFADNYINSELKGLGFATPATASLGILSIIATKLAAYQLYQVRGLSDKKNAFQAKFDWADAKLQELTYQNAGGFTRVAGYADAPAAVAPTVDTDGNPLTNFPAPYFDGRIWRYR